MRPAREFVAGHLAAAGRMHARQQQRALTRGDHRAVGFERDNLARRTHGLAHIGLRDDELEAAARKTAADMGHVEFDPGQTSCVMPDPIEYLEKTKAQRARQAAKRAARAKG